jgi:DeoR/GlpR family transcriptional regulator of sugar metabolism
MVKPKSASQIPAFDEESLPLQSYFPPQRRQAILDLVVQRGQVDVGELSELFGVSKVTVRSDLDHLARQNLITRSRGGAGSALNQSLALSFSVRALQNREQKRRIARAALGLLVPGETVIMDAGTTVVELSNVMSNAAELTIVTPALNIAIQLGSLPGVELFTVGGRLDPNTISNVGPIAEIQMQEVRAHKVFLGVHVIDQQGDLAEPIQEHAGLKRAMVRAARQVILLADSSKWGPRPAKAKVIALSACHTVVTDDGLDDRHRRAMEAEGIEVIVS